MSLLRRLLSRFEEWSSFYPRSFSYCDVSKVRVSIRPQLDQSLMRQNSLHARTQIRNWESNLSPTRRVAVTVTTGIELTSDLPLASRHHHRRVSFDSPIQIGEDVEQVCVLQHAPRASLLIDMLRSLPFPKVLHAEDGSRGDIDRTSESTRRIVLFLQPLQFRGTHTIPARKHPRGLLSATFHSLLAASRHSRTFRAPRT